MHVARPQLHDIEECIKVRQDLLHTLNRTQHLIAIWIGVGRERLADVMKLLCRRRNRSGFGCDENLKWHSGDLESALPVNAHQSGYHSFSTPFKLSLFTGSVSQ
jgi:hypothetical protein